MGLIAKILGREGPNSRQVAKERLQLVLVHDRIHMTPSQMAAMRDELLAVVTRYFDVDCDGVEITFTQNKRSNRLVAEVPVVGVSQRGAER
ncbi:MAG: cell division topological specificity factor MinE [Anaerolineae bacterium]